MPRPDPDPWFRPAKAKLWIASIDDPKLEVCAQYNPRELQVDKQVQWNDAKQRTNQRGAQRTDSSEQADLEFKSAAMRSMQIELLFDGFELGLSVEPDIEKLEQLSTVRNPESSEEDERRPHHCLVGWGAPRDGMRPFCCVIESLATKYTMWSTHGVPLRATCTLKLKEAERLSRKPRPLQPYGVKHRKSQYRDEWGVWDRNEQERERDPAEVARATAGRGPRR